MTVPSATSSPIIPPARLTSPSGPPPSTAGKVVNYATNGLESAGQVIGMSSSSPQDQAPINGYSCHDDDANVCTFPPQAATPQSPSDKHDVQPSQVQGEGTFTKMENMASEAMTHAADAITEAGQSMSDNASWLYHKIAD